MRPHVAAVYAFARTADDFADEDGYSHAERLVLLDAWQRRLQAAVGVGMAAAPDDAATDAPELNDARAAHDEHARSAPRAASPDPHAAIFLALGHTIRDLPAAGVAVRGAALSAFRQDATVTRYATWAELDDYCRRSANPVGRLVLRIVGYDDDRLDRWSDAVCTALQLTNFWQDFAETGAAAGSTCPHRPGRRPAPGSRTSPPACPRHRPNGGRR